MNSENLTMTMNDKIRKLMSCQTIHEMAVLIRDYPGVIISGYGYNTVMQRIPAIIKSSSENETPDFFFVQTIIDIIRERGLKVYSEEMLSSAYKTGGGSGNSWSNQDWGLTLIRTYFMHLLLHTHSLCLEVPRGVVEKLAILFYLLPYENMARVEMQYAAPIFSNKPLVRYFLKTFADSSVALLNEDESIDAMAEVITCNKPVYDENGAYQYGSFVDKCANSNISWLEEQLNEYFNHITCVDVKNQKSGKEISDLMEDCVNIFVKMGPFFSEPFIRNNLFYEYIALVNEYYPLEEERIDIIQRYERYFGDYAPIYAVDFIQDYMNHILQLRDYRTDAEVERCTMEILNRVERQFLTIHMDCPNINPKVVCLFYKDLTNAFGAGARGFTRGLFCRIEALANAIFQTNVTESDLSMIDLLTDAMEGSYGPDDKEDITESKDAKTKSSSDSNDGDKDDSNSDDEKIVRDNGSQSKKEEEKTTKYTRVNRRASEDNVGNMNSASRRIYSAYKKYKDGEEKVDNALQKGLDAIKRFFVGDQRAILIEGKPFTPLGFLKRAVLTVAIFNASKIRAILLFIVAKVLRKKANVAERRKLTAELERELKMVEEKLEDARGDGNREAKYQLMRTKMAYEEAIRRVKFGMSAEVRRQGISEDTKRRVRTTTNHAGYEG